MVGGWIYSKLIGWLVCWLISRLEVWMVSEWLARWLVCIWSVGRTNRPACYPTTDWPAIHPLTNQPQFFYKRSLLEFLVSEVRRIPVSIQPVGTVGSPNPCLQVAGQVWGAFHLASLGDIPLLALTDSLQIDLRTLPRGCVIWFPMSSISTYILMLHTAYSAPQTPTCNGLGSRFSQHPLDRNPG